MTAVGALYCVAMPITARMDIIERVAGESFQDSIVRFSRRQPITCAINGPMYELSSTGWATVMLGNVDPKEVTPRGAIVSQSGLRTGKTLRDYFYVAYDYLGGYTFGAGNPPANSARAVGGLGPLIIDGLPYGVSTLCTPPVVCPPTGKPPAASLPAMTQRSNNTFASFQSLPASTGKTILAANKQLGQLLVCVQANGGTGMSLEAIKLWLLSIGCDNAVFCDGSDSATLHAGGKFWVRPGMRKDHANTIGLAFCS